MGDIEKIVLDSMIDSGTNKDVALLHGGISNLNVRVDRSPIVDFPIVITYYTRPETFAKVEKEYRVREILNDRPQIPLQEILHTGTIEHSGRPVAYVIKKYIEGATLHSVLRDPNSDLKHSDLDTIFSELGVNLALFHKPLDSKFGDIVSGKLVDNWPEFFQNILHRYVSLLDNVQGNPTVMGYSIGNVRRLISHLLDVSHKLLPGLDGVRSASLTHGDVNFLNLLVNKNHNQYHLSGLLDLGSVYAGDPDVDLVAIESQLFLSNYQTLAIGHLSAFRDAYRIYRPERIDYSKKKTLYHISRSISYFSAMFNVPPELQNELNVVFADRHWNILEAIASTGSHDTLDLANIF